jgi:hypothetical protein
MAVLGVNRPQGGQPAAIFYPFGHPMAYAYVHPPGFEGLRKHFLKHILIKKFIGKSKMLLLFQTHDNI